ncbi:MAG: ribosomal-processing cysteine protease Prp [Ruminococcus sp.]|nr:ribosomal-processing cysteine protease Prp [Ruminococcus sp.]
MIRAVFRKDAQDRLKGFSVSGHAGLADLGEDICCASVTSAVMMAANTVTEAFKLSAEAEVLDNEIRLTLGEDNEGLGDKVLLGLMIHLYNLKDEFPGYISVRVEGL